jgi:hypothetical protein
MPLGNRNNCWSGINSNQPTQSKEKEVSIPQLNAEQVALLTSMATGVGAFSQVIPDAKLDSYKDYTDAMEVVRDNEQLVILGLVKEITDEEAIKEKMANIYAMTSRLWRVYEITAIGKAMFDGIERRIQ